MKTVLITGATSGIGEAAALLFLEKVWQVIATGRNEKALEKLSSKSAICHKLDVSNLNSVLELKHFLEINNFKIDVLVNNAGYGQFGTIEETPLELAVKQFETNVFGLASVTQIVIPFLKNSGGGRIINVSSIAGKVSMPGGGWYAASKHAVEAISDAMRWELSKFKIKVSIIEPGPIKTDFAANVNKSIVYNPEGPYGNLIGNLTGSTKSIKGGTVENCARIIYKAAVTKCPQNRYLVTKEAKLINVLIKITPSRLFDKIIIKFFKIK
jgi:short-subunit dehydrogenase